MFSVIARSKGRRRGVTLVEMLVSVALLVLMMTVIVQVFSAATGAVSAARAFQDLDSNLRKLDATLRQDLQNATARFTPPLDPEHNLGYYEYGENSFADLQGEDCDDYMRFTVKAPEGQFYTGRMFVPANPTYANMTAAQQANYAANYFIDQPITITSQYAEVIYFLRNNNLYRRVLLVAPERQKSISQFPPAVPGATVSTYYSSSPFTSANGRLPLGWQGVNDISARPSPLQAPTTPIILNTLGDLTNRENRFAHPRFGNDYWDHFNATTPGEGTPDDENADQNGNRIGNGIPDYYPTLYAGVFSANPNLVWELPALAPRLQANGGTMTPGQLSDCLAFPYQYPGMYSQPEGNSATNGYGWIHTPDPSNPALTVAQLNALNHNPIDLGDSLPIPTAAAQNQTWWGFPTWRETLTDNWSDPTVVVASRTQPVGLHPVLPANTTLPGAVPFNLLPPMTNNPVTNGANTANFPYRVSPQAFNDGAGQSLFATNSIQASLSNADFAGVWGRGWEDDLIATGVRSFDIKAYDDAFGGYVDLGWGDDLRLFVSYGAAAVPAAPQFLSSTNAAFTWPPNLTPPNLLSLATFAHEGRMPPLRNDNRTDPQFPNPNYPNAVTYSLGTFNYNGNVGDDQVGVQRMRRVWDSWSTDYTAARAQGFNPSTLGPIGPPFSPPVYPSYPPPYPAPLRGVRIQIRMVDPRNERIKVLTIHEDFTDRL